MASFEIRQFMCRTDNFGVLLHEKETGTTISIDAPEEGPILAELEKAGWTLTHILTTHHHGDHVAGNEALKARFHAEIVGPEEERMKIPGIDRAVSGGETIDVGGVTVEVISTPGHTLGEVSYYLPEAQALFAGDALFSLGCGRLFEGDPEMMWGSMQRLRVLPGTTMLYCGHEYTATNAKCALSVDPENLTLRERAKEVDDLRRGGRATLPVLLEREKKTNPFLRADDPGLMAAMGMEGAAPVDVFAAIRKKRDQY
ncbi:hydroxyacylglutathione hydrolase [Jiella endophytica]|uniref:Hydroxyacylglutathione hydrolase n=1 Tax=Jiella endophytica TaxID=2558362 RepID=A0A4Y8RTT2_9HYPH|nr:hydroxyacylglutathione hydrolase [Jiella endophytica]TFF20640.1 hydroxyacylglutathione hydrolase [Jiella endophytica]TFF26941.1 hydroxyacylglutathione hydrolase [Jiella endophytica]